jgi:hypothetical protein
VGVCPGAVSVGVGETDFLVVGKEEEVEGVDRGALGTENRFLVSVGDDREFVVDLVFEAAGEGGHVADTRGFEEVEQNGDDVGNI